MSDPAWHHLPHDPRSFFELPEEFDRRDLKRAYGKLIRQFKPETHPQEFQRIRAAYEQLENAERYGRNQASHQSAAEAWESSPTREPSSADSTSSPSPSEHSSVEPPPRPRPAAPLSPADEAIANPRETYVRLSQKDSRTPLEYYTLAVLSDLVKKPSERSKWQSDFMRWLLLGLKEHPGEPGLLSLLAGTLRGDVPLDQAAKVLPSLAKTIRSPNFYRLTEPLWERLVRQQPFEETQQLLQQCESELRQTDPRPRSAFYLRLLRTAIWKAPRSWSESKLMELSQHAADFDDVMHMDYEFIELLLDYLSNQQPASMESNSRATMDAFLRTYCTGDGPDATAEMIHKLDQIARNAHQIRTALPADSDEDAHALFMLMMMATGDLAETSGVVANQVDDEKNSRQAVSCLKDLKHTLETVGNRASWIDVRWKWLPFAGLYLLFGIVFTLSWILFMSAISAFASAGEEGALTIVALIGGLVAFPLAFFWWFYPKYLEPKSDVSRQRYFASCYEKFWRERVFRYVQSCGEAPSDSLRRLQEAAAYHDDTEWMNLVLSFCHGDRGLLIFARAQLFAG
ncbi:hypothetical protein [Rhodopirellula halodulae]|uniref:hypothetical protein n=1 Tax=Rhodopirellula halodulae TaxID=2894198 RepID=UPI001E3A8D11|nr:hypothetical protein [Rhodopirellula sp. JC737]MCC9655647.1 hypothetical protein [Rhodopirellula sp. JC737]